MADLFLGRRTGDDGGPTDPFQLPRDALTTHGVIVGMTGSGKTGLGIVLIEEVLRSGLPVLAIDPKGDLANLALRFPDLAAADFLPWIDPAAADRSGGDVQTYADDQARQWRDGLAEWGLDGSDIAALNASTDVTVYTPGSEAGIPLSLVGSLDVPDGADDPEVVTDEIEAYVSGLLRLVDIDADPLSSREHILLSNLIATSWGAGRALDLTTLVGQVAAPPIRKLGVFDLDQFFPEADRMAFAMRLNGLLASPSFASWSAGRPIDVQSMLFRDGAPRCAVVATAHLSEEERQFVTATVLSKVVTWMRRQSGTTDLRALVYMDEVAGYVPPTANPPTKKPVMTMMKQARAFGLGVVLSTQNPVDVDYKALSNAGTWMIGRLQTERDRDRLLDGMSSAAGDVDLGALADAISGLERREFVVRSPGAPQPVEITTRWAMSYLRGPLTKDQISRLMDPVRSAAPQPEAGAAASSDASAAATPELAEDESPLAPSLADGVLVRHVDVAAPWLEDVGGDRAGTRYEMAAVARVALHYDERTADLAHDDEYEAVLYPLAEVPDIESVVQVDYDDRDLRPEAPDGVRYALPPAPVDTKSFWNGVERQLRDHLTRTSSVEIQANKELKVFGRPGESADDVVRRCRDVADARADEEIAALRDKYESRAKRLRDQIEAAEDRLDVLDEEADARRNSELISGAGSVLGGLLGGRKSASGMLGGLLRSSGSASRRRGTSRAAAKRRDAAENKVDRLEEELGELEDELVEEVEQIERTWTERAAGITTIEVGLEKSDVAVTQLVAAWLPVG